MDDLFKEIQDIGRLITSAALLDSVRKEVGRVMKEGFVVTDGKHHPGAVGKYEVVVKCGADGQQVARRIKGGVPDVEVDKIAEGVLGVRKSRRSRDG
jgi:hypothetical protein